jgi:predicted negative regulator of RcsB-dependent stress response
MATHLDLEEQEQLDQLKHFWNTWGSLISTVVIVVAGALASWNGYQYWQNRKAAQATALFDAVDEAVRASDKSRMELAFSDLKQKYAGTDQAVQAALAVAKAMSEFGNIEGAKDALEWAATSTGDDGLKALARLRLANVLTDQEKYDEALKRLSEATPVEFEGIMSDRKGDIYVLKDRRTEAIAEYKKSFNSLEEGVEYRRLVETKLGALGLDMQASPFVGSAASMGEK